MKQVKYPKQQAYYKQKIEKGYKTYNIFDTPEIVEQVKAFYRSLKGILPKQ